MITSVDDACTHRGIGTVSPVMASDGTVRAFRC